MNNCFFNMSKCMFNTAFKSMFIKHRTFFVSFVYCNFCSFKTACAFKSTDFYNRATEFLLHCINVNFVAILFYNVHHVYGNNHWNTKLCKLSCKIKVTLKVCSVNNIQNCIWAFFYKIIT